MGTRSDIIVHLSNSKWKRVYCNWDGYISGVGAILFEHYNSQELAEALVGPGDMSSLHEHCSVYYGRDRGEKNMEGTTGDTLASVWPDKDSWTEFTYIWGGERKWFVSNPDDQESIISLEDALQRDKDGENQIKSFVKWPLGILAKRT